MCLIPLTALASYTPPFLDIAKEQGLTVKNNYAVVVKDGYYYIFFGNAGFEVSYADNTLKTNQDWNHSETFANVYKVSTSNPYSTWVSVSSEADDPFTNFTTNGRTLTDCYMVSNSYNIPVSVGYGSSVSGGKTTLSKFLNTSLVGGVLNEIISLLPVIIPVVIVFIAIRKGIRFVFSTLRSC